MSDGNKSPFLPVSGVLLLLAALGVIIPQKVPYKAERPPVTDIGEPHEKVRARLWQDPFLAVLDDGRGPEDRGSGTICLKNNRQSDCRAIFTRIKTKSAEGNVTILGVMEPGAPYAEERELRIRHRQAVLFGLGRQGFIPADSEHLDFITFTNGTPGESGKLSLSNIMPFEWLEQPREEGGRKKDSVLVLWLNEDVLKREPLQPLHRLAGIVDALGGKQLRQVPGVRIKFIGPAASPTLLAMLKDAEAASRRAEDKSLLQAVEMYSAIATADESFLLSAVGNGKTLSQEEARDKVKALFSGAGIAFNRTILTDRDLARALVLEMEQRLVRTGNGKGHVVLISEWDTNYGRLLRQVFTTEIGTRFEVLPFSYLRGLDGALPERKGAPGEKAEAGGKGDKSPQLEQPIGKSQYDYLRRLSDEIHRIDRHLKLTDGGRIAAVGVLGSDFYDKLLVLQALRQNLPEAIFFTTDLDARLLHPDNFRWTRNLVVASNFDLLLRDDIQKEVPPFRDNYQTSIFYAILAALADSNVAEPKVRAALASPLQPLIFEVGMQGAVDLAVEGGRSAFHPTHDDKRENLRVLLIACVSLLLLMIFLYLVSASVRQRVASVVAGGKGLVATAILAAIFLLPLSYFVWKIMGQPGEEPFSIFGGISIWPTEVMRLLAILLSFVFIVRAHQRLDANTREIKAEFGLPDQEELEARQETAPAFFKRKISSPGKILDALKYDWQPSRRDGKISNLWHDYLTRDLWRYRNFRVVPIVSLYLLLCFVIVKSFGSPVSPLRGGHSAALNQSILLACVFSFIFLTFYVFDVTRTCRQFITLANGNPKWYSDFVARFCPAPAGETGPLEEWMLVHLVAKRTEVVGSFIFYPFIVWVVMFISRLKFFDNWQTPIGLAIVISMGALIAWSCAFVLRRSAEKARTSALHRLNMSLAMAVNAKERDEGLIKRIEFASKDIKEVRDGAFAPFAQHPVLQALLVPFGGVGSVYLLEFLGRMNI